MFTLSEKIINDCRKNFSFDDVLICNMQYLIQCLMHRFRSIKNVNLHVNKNTITLNTCDRFGNIFTFYSIENLVYVSEFDIAKSIETLYSMYEESLIKESMR